MKLRGEAPVVLAFCPSARGAAVCRAPDLLPSCHRLQMSVRLHRWQHAISIFAQGASAAARFAVPRAATAHATRGSSPQAVPQAPPPPPAVVLPPAPAPCAESRASASAAVGCAPMAPGLVQVKAPQAVANSTPRRSCMWGVSLRGLSQHGQQALRWPAAAFSWGAFRRGAHRLRPSLLDEAGCRRGARPSAPQPRVTPGTQGPTFPWSATSESRPPLISM